VPRRESRTSPADVGALGEAIGDRYESLSQLRETTRAYRLLEPSAACHRGLGVDVYEPYAVLSSFEDRWLDAAQPLAELLVARGYRGVYLKRFLRTDVRREERKDLSPDVPLAGQPAPKPFVVDEGSQKIFIDLADGLSTGLFLDQRDSRQRLRSGPGERLLNLFSYTCNFTVAAALGAATSSVSVDLSGRALRRGREHFELNQLSTDGHRFIKEDALKWLERAGKRSERFDTIVVDPPSFSTVKNRVFRAERDFGELLARAAALLAPGGWLLAVTHYQGVDAPGFEDLVTGAAKDAGKRVLEVDSPELPLDCRPAPDVPPLVKNVWMRVA
jgi:23S rRNA (cytosine1962-C5)-methyltransferase